MANPTFKFTVDQELLDAIKAHTEALNRFAQAATARQAYQKTAAAEALAEMHPVSDPYPQAMKAAEPAQGSTTYANPSTGVPVASTAQTGAAIPAATPAVPTAVPVAASPTVPAPVPSQADIMRAGGELMSRRVDVRPLLQKYNIQMVTQLPVEQYPAFVADLRAMGANI